MGCKAIAPSAQSRSTSAGSGASSEHAQLPRCLLEDLGFRGKLCGKEAFQSDATEMGSLAPWSPELEAASQPSLSEPFWEYPGLEAWPAEACWPADGSWLSAEFQAPSVMDIDPLSVIAEIGLPPGLEHLVPQQLAASHLSESAELGADDAWMSEEFPAMLATSEWHEMSSWDAYHEDWTAVASSPENFGMPPIEWEPQDWTASMSSPHFGMSPTEWEPPASQVLSTSPALNSNTNSKAVLTTSATMAEWPEFPSIPETLTADMEQPVVSIGSEGHFRGQCNPCAFAYTKGCSNGVLCEFCHLCDAGAKKRRAKELWIRSKTHLRKLRQARRAQH